MVVVLRFVVLAALSCVTSALQMQRSLPRARACLPDRARCGQHVMTLDMSLLLAASEVAGAGGTPDANDLFKIGASLALTSIVTTLFVGLLVSMNYDNIEARRLSVVAWGCARRISGVCARAPLLSCMLLAHRRPCTRSRTLRGATA